MRCVRRIVGCWLLSGCAVLTGQSPSENSSQKRENAFVIKTSARAVLLNVLVTDRAGEPVHGLKPRDFTVLEDGKPQQIQGFEESGTNLSRSSNPVAPSLPPHTYSNYVATHEPGAINILLLDLLNTDRASLANARRQMLLYLSKLPGDARIALFTLDWDLHLVHGFTDDTRELIEAAGQLSSSPHPMFSNSRGVSEELAVMKEGGLSRMPKAYKSMAQFLWAEQEGKEESRMTVTLEALNQLARSMAIYAGRKNLIWISGGVPFNPASSAPQVQRTATLLAATQMTVYPIDARGAAFLGADGATRSSEIYAPVQTQSYETLSGQGDELLSVRETMIDVANLTGGHAYYNRNDLQSAIRDSVNAGSNYYVLSYRPRNDNWNGKFRKIKVKVSPPQKVQCRPGYYAVPDPLASPDIDRSFSLAMQPGAPLSTTLIIKARVLAPETAGKPAQIDFLVDAHDLSFKGSIDHRQAPDIMFVSALWDAKGKPGGAVSATYRQAVTAAELESLMRTGLRLHQEIPLEPGTYDLRLGVVDRGTGKIGTLDVPLTVESKVAIK